MPGSWLARRDTRRSPSPPAPAIVPVREWADASAVFLLDLRELCPHAITPGSPFEEEFAPSRLTADVDEPQELEGLRLSEPAPSASVRRMAAKLDQAGLLRIKRQRELLQPLAHRIPELPGVHLVLKTNDDVVGIAHDDHVAGSLAPSPAFGPEIEGVVQVDVGEQR